MNYKDIDRDFFKEQEETRQKEVQNKILILLKEVDSICKENNINYYFADHLLYGAVMRGGFIPHSCSSTILMTGEDRKKFIEVCLKKGLKDDRYIECLETNKEFPGLAIHYGDKNSTLFHVEEFGFFQNYGIHVVIETLKPLYKNKIKGNLSKSYYRGLEVRVFKVKGNIGKYMNFANNIVKTVFRLYGINKGIKKMVNYIFFSNNTYDKYSVSSLWEKRKYVPKEIVEKYGMTKVTFEGYEFDTFSHYNEYLKCKFGIQWATRNIVGRKMEYPVISEPDIPYEEYLNQIYSSGINEKEYLEKNSLLRKYNNQLKWLRKYTNKQWDIVCCSWEKINLKKEYLPIKDELNRLFEDKNIDELLIKLNDYLKKVYEYMSKTLALYFDGDILVMMLIMMADSYRFLDMKKYLRAIKPNEFEKEIIKKYLNLSGRIDIKEDNIDESLKKYYKDKKESMSLLYEKRDFDSLKKELNFYFKKIYEYVDKYKEIIINEDKTSKINSKELVFDIDILKMAVVILLYNKDLEDVYFLINILQTKDLSPYLYNKKMQENTFKWIEHLADNSESDIENDNTKEEFFGDN